jgi:hypothetical protein
MIFSDKRSEEMDGSDEVSSKQRVKGSDPSANNTDDISV